MKTPLAVCAALYICCAATLCGLTHAQTLLVVNQGNATVSFIDPIHGAQVAVLPEKVAGVHGHEIAASEDGRTAFLPIYGSSGVGRPGVDGHQMLVIDIPSRKIVGDVDFGHGVRPHKPVLDPVHHLLYVTTEMDRSVTIVDPRTRRVVGSISTEQPESHMLAISHDGRRAYTANVGPGTVSVLDLVGRKTVAILPISGSVQRISISNDDKWVFTADQTEPRLAVVDTATNKVAGWVALPGVGYGTAPTKDGRSLLVAVPSMNEVAVVDLATKKVVRRIKVPSHPQEILVRPDGKVAYVSCNASGKVAVIDLGNWSVERTIAAGSGADGLAWAK